MIMVRRLLKTTGDKVFMIDDLSIGIHPSLWMEDFQSEMNADLEVIGADKRLFFWKGDFRDFLFYMRENPRFIQDKYNIDLLLLQ